MGVRQTVIVITPVNMSVIVRTGHIAMRRGAVMAVLAQIVASYWHVHFQVISDLKKFVDQDEAAEKLL